MNGIINLKKYIALSLMVATLGFFTQCAEEFDSPETISGNTLVDVAATDTTLEIFTAALAKTGIGISLDNVNSGQHTVFAPTDSAFRVYFKASAPGPASNYNTDAGVISYINTMSSSSAITLAAFTLRLQYHIVSSEALAADITNSKVFTTIHGARLSLSKSGSNVLVNANAGANGAKSRKLDIDGANGVIHTIDKFLTAISTGSVVTNTLGIAISYSTSPPTVTVGATSGDNYDLFAAAIKKTGLATILRPNVATASLPDFTIFAPQDPFMQAYLAFYSGTVTDEATAKTFINSLDGTTTPTLATFTDLIKYHIVAGRVLTTDLSVNQIVSPLLTGKTFTVTTAPSIQLKDATDALANVTSSNTLTNAGVLHRLGAVLKPIPQ